MSIVLIVYSLWASLISDGILIERYNLSSSVLFDKIKLTLLVVNGVALVSHSKVHSLLLEFKFYTIHETIFILLLQIS